MTEADSEALGATEPTFGTGQMLSSSDEVSTIFSETIFIDTNAFAYIRTYLDIAKKRKLPPYGEELTGPELKKRLQHRVPDLLGSYAFNGATALSYLHRNAKDTGAYYISVMSVAETVNSMIELQISSALSKVGFGRGRQNNKQKTALVKQYIDTATRNKIVGSVNALCERLSDDLNISILVYEREQKLEIGVITTILDFLLANTLLDIQDAWIAAAAVTSLSKSLVTYDGDFSSVMNLLHNPQKSADWKKLSRELKKLLEGIFGEEHLNVKLTTPQAHGPKEYGGLGHV